MLKEKGTQYFKLDNYKLARKFYKKMLYYLQTFLKGIYYYLVYIVYIFVNYNIMLLDIETESLQEKIKSLKIKSYLNSALCYLKIYKFTQALDTSDKVLKIEPTNVKAMFRKGEVCITFLVHMCCMFKNV